MKKSEISKTYRDKFPDMPTLKLARIVYEENKIMFKDIEAARASLRYIEGKTGKKDRKNASKSKYFMQQDRPKNPYNLPESHQEVREPYILPKGCNNILLISDLHIPYHDITAITIALDYGKANNINTIFINGDLIDNHQISRFEKDMRKRSVKQEFDATKEFLVALRDNFPNAEIYWLKGNHCIRWEKFLMQKVQEIWDDPYFYLEERLRLNEQRIKMIDDKVLVKAGKLAISHGHHIVRGSSVSPARGAWNKAKQSVVIGHLHRVSSHPEVDLDGKVTMCYSLGCLCHLRPDYNPLVANAQHGFAHVIVNNDGTYVVKNFQIIDGKLY